ncbi:MAG: glycosyl hydrolase [Planctomycetota bacterium]|jgi:mannan endo-1,4-beta-mannosidase|nr:glycosyl hydrolase [Planctomycetota bacterium]
MTCANPAATPATCEQLTYLNGLSSAPEPRFLSGVFTAECASTLAEETGHHAALIGVEYCRGFGIHEVDHPSQTIAWRELNPALIIHAAAGGMVRVLSHFPNPCNARYGGLRDKDADITAILQAGTAARARWLAMLDELAAGFHDLAQHGITVIYGPLHEMNCNGFWWGATPERIGIAGYRALWADLFHYLSVEKGCDNLLWLFAPLGHDPLDMQIYPGDNMVDLVGLDVYGGSIVPCTPVYQQLAALDKPVVLSEYGPVAWNEPEDNYPRYDCRLLAHELATHWPQICSFMFWGGHFAPSAHDHADAMLADPRVITRHQLATERPLETSI